MAKLANLTPQQLQALLEGPALAPPLGVIPQLAHPPNLRVTGVAVQVVCLILATLALCMRVYTKVRIIGHVVLADCQFPNQGPEFRTDPMFQTPLCWAGLETPPSFPSPFAHKIMTDIN